MNNALPATAKTKDGRRYPTKQKRKQGETEYEPELELEEEEKKTAEPEDPEPPSTYVLKSEQQYSNGKDLKPYYTIPQWEALGKAEQLRLLTVTPHGAFNWGQLRAPIELRTHDEKAPPLRGSAPAAVTPPP
jgi:hypothetical protein